MKRIKQIVLSLLVLIPISCTSTPAKEPTSTQSAPFLDFDHPRLHEIAGNNLLIIREIVRTRRYHEETPHAAVIVDIGDPVFRLKMLVFRLEGTGAVLVYESDPYHHMSFHVTAVDPAWLIDNSNYYFHHSIQNGIGSFGSNLLEIPVEVGNGGNCYDCSGMKIIAIDEAGTARDITPVSTFNPKTFINLDEKLEIPFTIIATRFYESSFGACSRAGSPFAFRLFSWDGMAYVDVSASHPGFYDEKTLELKTRLEATFGNSLNSCLVMPLLAGIFFNFESSGRVDQGWELITALGDLDHWDMENTTEEEIRIHQEVFELLEQRRITGIMSSTAVP